MYVSDVIIGEKIWDRVVIFIWFLLWFLLIKLVLSEMLLMCLMNVLLVWMKIISGSEFMISIYFIVVILVF